MRQVRLCGLASFLISITILFKFPCSLAVSLSRIQECLSSCWSTHLFQSTSIQLPALLFWVLWKTPPYNMPLSEDPWSLHIQQTHPYSLLQSQSCFQTFQELIRTSSFLIHIIKYAYMDLIICIYWKQQQQKPKTNTTTTKCLCNIILVYDFLSPSICSLCCNWSKAAVHHILTSALHVQALSQQLSRDRGPFVLREDQFLSVLFKIWMEPWFQLLLLILGDTLYLYLLYHHSLNICACQTVGFKNSPCGTKTPLDNLHK